MFQKILHRVLLDEFLLIRKALVKNQILLDPFYAPPTAPSTYLRALSLCCDVMECYVKLRAQDTRL